MNHVRLIAAKAYDIYLKDSRQQLSPQDALWHTDQYLESHPDCGYDEAVEFISKSMIENE